MVLDTNNAHWTYHQSTENIENIYGPCARNKRWLLAPKSSQGSTSPGWVMVVNILEATEGPSCWVGLLESFRVLMTSLSVSVLRFSFASCALSPSHLAYLPLFHDALSSIESCILLASGFIPQARKCYQLIPSTLSSDLFMFQHTI